MTDRTDNRANQYNRLCVEYDLVLNGWCVFEVAGERRSFPMQFAGMAEEKRLQWEQQLAAGLVPSFDIH